MFTSRRDLTRHQRARRYFVALSLPAVVLLFLIWGPRRYAAASADGHSYEAVMAWGAFPYFETTEVGSIGTGGAGLPSAHGDRFVWEGILKCLALTLILEGLLIGLHRALVAAGRLKGRCDECGYDLRGLTSSRCPECGNPLQPGDTRPLKEAPADADEAVEPTVRWEGRRRRLIWTSDQRG